jgi:hypothetical protein
MRYPIAIEVTLIYAAAFGARSAGSVLTPSVVMAKRCCNARCNPLHFFDVRLTTGPFAYLQARR